MTLTDLTDEISPFPLNGNLLHSFQPTSQPEFRSPLPLQKLRPVRNNQYVTEYSDFPTIIDTGMLPENEGSLIENLEYSHQVGDSAPEIEVKPIQEVVYGSGFSGNESMEWMERELVEKEGSGGGGGGGAGNRWPREETLALLKIRAEMDSQFRDANPKVHGPLWEIISRKLEQMGYHRDPKKCQEKFQNMYKYYRKTKEKLPLKDDCQGGKFYKFFTELKAFDNQHEENRIGETGLEENNTIIQTPDPVESSVKEVGLKNSLNECLFNQFCLDYDDDDDDDDDEGGDELEEENVECLSRKRKRTHDELKLYCENLVKEMMKKQEQMYQHLVDRMDKMEKDRMMREAAWKRQEVDRMKREKEMRDQEMSRNLALVSFLEKFVGQQIPIQQSPELYQEEKHEETGYKVDSNNMRWPKVEVQVEAKHEESKYKFDSNNKRWPKPEVQALISLRTAMEEKYRSAAPKGPPLWDEISLAMSTLGYNRSAKKCKEKWENINKYFKRAVCNGKKRLGNEKTCSYFRELDIIYKNRLLNPEKTPDETNDEGKERSTKGEMLTTLAQVCNLFSMSEPLEPMGDQPGSSLVRSNDIHSNI